MEGVGRMLPSQTGAATRPSTVAPMTRPQPQRLEAVVQPQQQAALRHKQVKHWHMRFWAFSFHLLGYHFPWKLLLKVGLATDFQALGSIHGSSNMHR